MSAPLAYADPELGIVEMHDQVELRLGHDTFDGVVVAIHPRLRAVTVRYDDDIDCHPITGRPRRKSVRVPVGDVDLMRRDG